MTERNVQLHTANQTAVGASSSVSVVSSAERAKRFAKARAALNLAEAQMEMIHAAEEMAAGSQAGSVGRRLEDVQSEVGSSSGPLTTVLQPTVETPF